MNSQDQPRRIVLAGGTGQVGQILQRAFAAAGDDVTVLSRCVNGPDQLAWDGRQLGEWAEAVDGADAVVNLAGRSVNCRYTEANLKEMLNSRVDSTRVIGEAIARARRPPSVWLQMSTATLYAHTLGPAHTESCGAVGGNEPEVPAYWRRSVDIALAWEATLAAAPTPCTRKVALRTAMVMSPDRGGILDVLSGLTRAGLGGPIAGGGQYVSWIADADLVTATELLLRRDDISGPVNLCAPEPLPHREFMAALRQAWGQPIGLPATAWMAELGAWAMRTDTELLLKSRRVVPERLLQAGMTFAWPSWPEAAGALVARFGRREGS